MRPARAFALVLAALGIVSAAPSARGQEPLPGVDTVRVRATPLRIEGVVRDTFDRPLRAAEVRVGERVSFTDSLGRFRIDSLFRMPVHILVRRIGYEPAATSLEARENVHRVAITVRLEPAAVQLSTVVVEGQRVPALLLGTGYFQRKRIGRGKFYDGTDLEHLGGSYVSLLGSIPGVTVHFGRAGAIFALGYAMGGLTAGKCVMDVYLDGRYVSWAASEGINWVLPPRELLAMEVYARASQVPASIQRFGGRTSRSLCGAVLLWSKPLTSPDPDEPR